MGRSIRFLMALAMAVSVSASVAVLSGCGVASGSRARGNTGVANVQTGTAAVGQTGGRTEASTNTNTDTSTDTDIGFRIGGNSSPGEKMIIEYWHCNAEIQGGLVVNELVKQFNKSNDHIQVVAKYSPGMYRGLVQNLQAETAVDNSPMLVWTGWAFLDYSFNNFSYVSPQEAIDRFDKEDAGFLQNRFFPNVPELVVSSQGSQVGVPYSLSNPVLCINKDTLREAGLAEDGPTAWQEAGELAKTIKEKTGEYGFYMRESADFWVQQGLIESSGVKMLATNTEGRKGVPLATEDGIKAIQLIADMVKGQTTSHISQEEGCQSLIGGNCAMLYTAIARRASVQKGTQFDVATVESPLRKNKGHMVPAGGCFLAITAQGDNQIETAWEFEKFLYSAESMATWTEGAGYVPLRKDMVGAENGLEIFLAENKMMNVAIQQTNGVVPWTAFPGEAGLQAEQMLLDMRDQTPGGRVTTERGMKTAQDAISQLLVIW